MDTQTKTDIDLVYRAVKFIYDQKVEYIFPDKKIIDKVQIAAYTHSAVFLINPITKEFTEYKYSVPDKLLLGWQANLHPEIYDALPQEIKNQNRFENPIISGSLCTEFIKAQKSINFVYDTIESFLATILHEYAHIYYNAHKKFYYYNNKENIKFMSAALELLEGTSNKIENMWIPEYSNMTEVYAHCAETDSARIFWPEHYDVVRKLGIKQIKRAVEKEKSLKLDMQDSTLHDPHLFAAIMGTFMLNKYPATWPQELLR